MSVNLNSDEWKAYATAEGVLSFFHEAELASSDDKNNPGLCEIQTQTVGRLTHPFLTCKWKGNGPHAPREEHKVAIRPRAKRKTNERENRAWEKR